MTNPIDNVILPQSPTSPVFTDKFDDKPSNKAYTVDDVLQQQLDYLNVARRMSTRCPDKAESKLFMAVDGKLTDLVNQLDDSLTVGDTSTARKSSIEIHDHTSSMLRSINENITDKLQQSSDSADDDTDYNPIVMFLAVTIAIMREETRAAQLVADSANLLNQALDKVSDLQKFAVLMKDFYQKVLLQKQQQEAHDKKSGSTQVSWFDSDIITNAEKAGYSVEVSSPGTRTTWSIMFNPDQIPPSLQQYFGTNNGKICINEHDIVDSLMPAICQAVSLVLPSGSTSDDGGLTAWTNAALSSTENDQFVSQIDNTMKMISSKSDQLSGQVSLHQNNSDTAFDILSKILEMFAQVMNKIN
jgi:hypothetical protein